MGTYTAGGVYSSSSLLKLFNTGPEPGCIKGIIRPFGSTGTPNPEMSIGTLLGGGAFLFSGSSSMKTEPESDELPDEFEKSV